jgi:hypothetical protein
MVSGGYRPLSLRCRPRAQRSPIIIEADGRWYVGPGNGLFELVQRRAGETRSWHIDWKPEHLSSSFHGRDLFAPVAAMLARGEPPPGQPCQDGAHRRSDWPDDLCEIAYVDHFGNAIVGVRAAILPSTQGLRRPVGCWSARGLSAIYHQAWRSGMRIRTGLPKLPSIWGARTVTSVLRSAVRSRSSLERRSARSPAKPRWTKQRNETTPRVGRSRNDSATSCKQLLTGVF